ncbi:MAG: 30S ribosomal protein S13 [Candidatus Diapherotrites archaeon]|uniref:30S ribosomal protein S13 n=1 Tax=Candidatus Iainarchaeum sp. TaxID=3101447 RepID=A0A938YUK4_9ARCH|nr:30S ribosomal protein S13 [Candidatus Diapherotrites archaeon]
MPEEKQEKKAETQKEQKPKGKEIRYIVRIATKDLDGNMPIYRALAKIKGIGIRMAKNIAIVFEKEDKIAFDSKLGLLPEELDKKLEDIVLNPEKHGIPIWSLNKQKETETGENKHLVMADLDFGLRKDLQRLNLIKSYRGLRHSWGLTVRGQRTKSTHRGKGGVVGVMKKDARIAMGDSGKKTEKKESK